MLLELWMVYDVIARKLWNFLIIESEAFSFSQFWVGVLGYSEVLWVVWTSSC